MAGGGCGGMGTIMLRVGGAGWGGPGAAATLLKKSIKLPDISVNEGRS